jgi:predicted transcriptional regulator of viral defense system
MTEAGKTKTRQHLAVALLRQCGMLRLAELRRHGITAATISRLERRGEVVRLARGLYQLGGAPLHEQHALAEAAKLVPMGGVVCLISALAFHQLTDQIPAHVWIAMGQKIGCLRAISHRCASSASSPTDLTEG